MGGVYSQADLEAKFQALNQRLQHIEEHLVRISRDEGGYTPTWSSVPDEVVELARSGDRLGAAKRYRELTGASLDQAREVLAGL